MPRHIFTMSFKTLLNGDEDDGDVDDDDARKSPFCHNGIKILD